MPQNENTGMTGAGLSVGEGSVTDFSAALDAIRQAMPNKELPDNMTGEGVASLIKENTSKLGAYMSLAQRNIENLARREGTDSDKVVESLETFKQQQQEIKELMGRFGAPDVLSREYGAYSRLQRSVGQSPDMEGIEDEGIRSALRVQRAKTHESGSSELGEEDREHWENVRSELKSDLSTLFEEFSAAREGKDKEAQQRISMEISGKSNLVQQVENVLEYNMRQNAGAVDKVLGFVGNLAGMLSVGQIASRAFIQDPFQFRFQPAMGMLANQGEVGGMLSGALSSAEQYNVQMNQMLLTGGIGGAIGGMSMMRGATTFGGGLGGGILMGAGILAGVGGATGVGTDVLQSLGVLTDDDDIIAAQLAESAVDPGRILDHYTQSRAGLLQAGAGPNLGFDLNNPESRHANAFIGNLSDARGNQLRRLGFNDEQIGQMLTSASQQMRGDGEVLGGAVTTAARLEGAYGVSADATLANLATIQRAGVGPEEAQARLSQSMGAVMEDGTLSGFAQNVLVPSLNQVLESMAVQNVARSQEDLANEVYGFRAMFRDSETNLGRLVASNPEAYSRLYSTMVQGVKSSLDDPARMAYNLSRGSSFMDIIGGSPEVTMRAINDMMGYGAVNQIDWSNPDSPMAAGVLRNLSAMTGIGDMQMLIGLLELAQSRGGQLRLEDVEAASEEADRAVAGRVEGATEGLLGDLMESTRTQQNEVINVTAQVMDDVKAFQQQITDIISDNRFSDTVREGIAILTKDIKEALDGLWGVERDSGHQPEGDFGGEGDPSRATPALAFHNSLEDAGIEDVGVRSSILNSLFGDGNVPNSQDVRNTLREHDIEEGTELFQKLEELFTPPSESRRGDDGASIEHRREGDSDVIIVRGMNTEAFNTMFNKAIDEKIQLYYRDLHVG